MATVLDDLGAVLATAGVGTVGTTIFYGGLPASPAACVALIEYGGAVPTFTLPATAGIQTEQPRVQILSRHTTHALARATAELAYRTLATVVNQTLTATRYLRIEPLQPPFFSGVDQNERSLYIFNVSCEKALS
jgi:hypothetical protein